MIHWILESNLKDEPYLKLISVLEKNKIPYTMVKVVPYANILLSTDFDTFNKEPTEEDDIKINERLIFPFGTMSLSSVAVKRKWKPGSLFNDQFTFEKWSKGFGLKNLLNHDSKIMKVSEPIEGFKDDIFFIRPCEDDKAFSGKVINKKDFLDWQESIIKIDDSRSKLNKNTLITIATKKEIYKEARMFVFNGKVVTGSYYKFNDEVSYKEVLDGDPIIEYTKNIILNYQPAKAFVIDIALTDKGYKIIEINNINSVGLYNSNIDKFVEAITNTFG